MVVVLFHYTSVVGANEILRDGYVRPSHGRGARHGVGVYLTTKDPLIHNERAIAQNNFDGAWKYEGRIHKVKMALAFVFSEDEVQKLSPRHGGDAWLYTNGNLRVQDRFSGHIFLGGISGYMVVQEDTSQFNKIKARLGILTG